MVMWGKRRRRKEEPEEEERETRGQCWSCSSRGAVEVWGSSSFRSLAERRVALRGTYGSGSDSRPSVPRSPLKSWRVTFASPPLGPIRDKAGGHCSGGMAKLEQASRVKPALAWMRQTENNAQDWMLARPHPNRLHLLPRHHLHHHYPHHCHRHLHQCSHRHYRPQLLLPRRSQYLPLPALGPNLPNRFLSSWLIRQR